MAKKGVAVLPVRQNSSSGLSPPSSSSSELMVMAAPGVLPGVTGSVAGAAVGLGSGDSGGVRGVWRGRRWWLGDGSPSLMRSGARGGARRGTVALAGRSTGVGAVETLEEAAVAGAVTSDGSFPAGVEIGFTEASSVNGLVALTLPSFNLLRAAARSWNLSAARFCVSVSGVHHA